YGDGMAMKMTFTFTSSVVIPAGGYLLAGTSASTAPFFQLASTGPVFDPTCGNYTGLGGATPDVVGTYYEDPSWVLYESGNTVCEWNTAATSDPATGIPAG